MMKEHLCMKCLSETCPNTGYDTSIVKCTVYIPPKPITKADRIRAMTDEGLAEFINGVEAEAIRRAGLFITVGDIQRGKEGWLDWLRQEAEDDE